MCGSNSGNHKILGKRLNTSQGRSPGKKVGITVTICRCTDCGLIFSNPQPIPQNLQDHYGFAPESYWDTKYFSIDDNYFKNEITKLKELITFKEGMKSLDIGAGLGKQMIALSKAGFDTYGLEPSSTFYERAITQMNINPENLKNEMVESVEYPSNYFDFISLGVVLEHLYNPSDIIESTLRWLKPNGVIHVEVPSSDWLISKLINLYYKLTFRDYVCNLSPMHIPYHLYEFSLKSFEKNSKNKYKIAFHEYYVCKTFLPAFTDFLIKPIMRNTNTGMQLCVWLKKL